MLDCSSDLDVPLPQSITYRISAIFALIAILHRWWLSCDLFNLGDCNGTTDSLEVLFKEILKQERCEEGQGVARRKNNRNGIMMETARRPGREGYETIMYDLQKRT